LKSAKPEDLKVHSLSTQSSFANKIIFFAIANIYPVLLLKDHLNNNALEIDVESAKSIPGMGSTMLVRSFNP